MKIAVVMQSFLGDYPGARKNPEIKFVRAISSFLSQTHEDKELIIVSDGCEKTKQIYNLIYYNDSRIKFCFLDKKNEKRMYEIDGNKKVFRGKPKKIGCSLADADIITYMDSDDILLSNRLSDLDLAWSIKSKEIKWASNPFRYLHSNALVNSSFKEKKDQVEPLNIINLKKHGYDINDSFWLNRAVPEGKVFAATYCLSHRIDIKSSWKDVFATCDENGNQIAGVSEDVAFLRELQDQDGVGFRQESASYVVCHYKNVWDV